MTVFTLFLVFAVGCVAGFVNVMAGGGSLLTLPMLVFAGLPMPVANATNRVAILLQNTVATKKFHSAGVLSIKEALFYSVPATIGSFAGTSLAIELNPKILQIIIAVIILIMAVLLVLKPDMWESERKRDLPKWFLVIVFFFIGVYGGFVQAGVGFLFLWVLSGVIGHDLLHSNAIKVTVILAYTVVSLALFMINGMVNLPVGLTLACGSMLGGYLGVRFSVARGNRWIRYVLATMVVFSAVKMIYSAMT